MADLQISERDGIQIIEVIESDCAQLWPTIQPLVEGGKSSFVLDFAKVNYLNSMNIAAVISMRNKVWKENGRVCLANVQENIRSVFRILKLEKLFDLELDLDAAIEAVK